MFDGDITPTLLPIDIRQAQELIALVSRLPPEEHFAMWRALRADPDTQPPIRPRLELLLNDAPRKVAHILGR